jgi:hypothetical protein
MRLRNCQKFRLDRAVAYQFQKEGKRVVNRRAVHPAAM